MSKYRVADGREVILPRGLARSPTGDNARLTAGQDFEIDLENPENAVHRRFIRARIRAGDLVALESRDLPTTAAAPAKAPPKEGDR